MHLHLRQERDARRSAAWRHLVQLFGGQRASWVARETKPSDWDTLAANGDEVVLVGIAVNNVYIYGACVLTSASHTPGAGV